MADSKDSDSANPELVYGKPSSDTITLSFIGDWVIGNPAPAAEQTTDRIGNETGIRRLSFDTGRLGHWDSLLLIFLFRLINDCNERGIAIDRSGLPEGVQGLLQLAYAVPERQGARRSAEGAGLLEQVGQQAIDLWQDVSATFAFIGEASHAWMRFLHGRARYRKVDLWLLIQDCGAQALPIVTLISVLIGLILAFVGAMQLRMFGAEIYIADLVGLGMSREMGAMMTGIIMAGRTGAAYAAQLGTMQVNSEIDALKTMGLSPMEFLVLPRMFALILMMPLLCLYSDFLGITGGALVSIGMFDISFLEYFQHVRMRLDLVDFAVGVGKSAVFGVLVAVAGCMRGMQCGRSSLAVGFAATSAVVTGIVFIIASDSIMTVILTVLKI